MARVLFFAIIFLSSSVVWAQRAPGGMQSVDKNPQEIGAEGVAWYSTWDTGLAEAKRSNRPIFFMSAAAQCSGVPGVF